jgi:hypothetical protein
MAESSQALADAGPGGRSGKSTPRGAASLRNRRGPQQAVAR